jgi:hypothetical protein
MVSKKQDGNASLPNAVSCPWEAHRTTTPTNGVSQETLKSKNALRGLLKPLHANTFFPEADEGS